MFRNSTIRKRIGIRENVSMFGSFTDERENGFVIKIKLKKHSNFRLRVYEPAFLNFQKILTTFV